MGSEFCINQRFLYTFNISLNRRTWFVINQGKPPWYWLFLLYSISIYAYNEILGMWMLGTAETFRFEPNYFLYVIIYWFFSCFIENGFCIKPSILWDLNIWVKTGSFSTSKEVINNTFMSDFICLIFLAKSNPFITGILQSEMTRW